MSAVAVSKIQGYAPHPILPGGLVSYDVYSIDALNGPDGWTWNDKRRVARVTLTDREDTPEGVLRFLTKAGLLISLMHRESRVKVEAVEQVPFMWEVQDKETNEPLFALIAEREDS